MEAGQTIAGRYKLETPIGEGAMASVWRAEDLTLKRHIAIKFLYVKGTRDPQGMVDQFLREARIAASVQHRNVIQTVDFGTVDECQPFMVMELLSGESFGDRMEREPRLTREQVVHLVSLTLRGLAAVHDAGIVHRDLKPHNIFLQRDADAVYPKILDFGISRSLEQGEERPSAIATQEGMIVGTPDYMSPEQARGEANIDKRADIYAMGCILYEGLTGRLPFQATNIGELIVQIVTQEPPTAIEVAPDVPPHLSAMIMQAMAKDREHRFADARAMRSALLAAAEQSLPPSRRSAISRPPPTHANVASPVAAPGVVAPPAAAASYGDNSGATWGDFEGLGSQNMRDAEPAPGPRVPSGPPPPSKQRLQASGGGSLELAEDPVQARRGRTTPEGARGPGAAAKGARKKPAPPPATGISAADALDPLYAGANQGALELDYGPGGGGARHPAATKPRRAAAAQRPRPARTPRSRGRSSSGRSIGPWLLPLAALVLVGYFVLKPSGPQVGAGRGAQGLQGLPDLPSVAGRMPSNIASGASVVADSDFKSLRLQAKQRRSGLKKTAAHMRDVTF